MAPYCPAHGDCPEPGVPAFPASSLACPLLPALLRPQGQHSGCVAVFGASLGLVPASLPWRPVFCFFVCLTPSSDLTWHAPSPRSGFSELTELFIHAPTGPKGRKLPHGMKRPLLPPSPPPEC